MAKLQKPIRPSEVEQPSFDLLPPGWYPVAVVAEEIKPTAAGDGSYLEVTLQVAENHQGAAGRQLWARFNLDNPNERAVEIATSQLAGLAESIGLQELTDTEQLIGGRALARVVIRPARGEYQASNDVKEYRPVTASGASSPAAAPSQPWSRPPGSDQVPF